MSAEVDEVTIDASTVMVTFMDEHKRLTQVPVPGLLNELFTAIHNLEDRVKKLEEDKPNGKSSIILSGN